MATLEQGGVIAYPTETVFGLGVDPFNPQAVCRLLALKGRTSGKGLILLIPDASWVDTLAHATVAARRLMAHFWPGPLTLVLPKSTNAPPWITGDSDHIALRLSPHPTVVRLLAAWKKPLVSTSANLSGGPALRTPQAIAQQWQQKVAVVLPGHATDLPSTVLLVAASRIDVLRQGAIPASTIFQFLDH